MAFEGVRRKKRSSILVFLVLFVSFCFLIISLSVVGSISETNHEMFQIVYGDWDYAILNGREEDAAFLAEKQEEGLIETLGRMENYGTIRGLEGWVGFGTLDEGMIEAGRLSLEGGRWPQAENEIALEASTLRSLGVEPEVGQTVTLTVELPRPPAPVTVDCTFTVSGIIREYSSLWMFNYNKTGKLPVSAVVTEETAQEVLRQARAQVPDGEKIQPFPQYFAAAPEDNLLRLQLGGQLDAYLKETRDVSTEDIKAATNPVSSLSVQQTDLNGFYFGLILWVTMLAVACAYLLQLPSEQHRFAVLRSIGAGHKAGPCAAGLFLGQPAGGGGHSLGAAGAGGAALGAGHPGGAVRPLRGGDGDAPHRPFFPQGPHRPAAAAAAGRHGGGAALSLWADRHLLLLPGSAVPEYAGILQ